MTDIDTKLAQGPGRDVIADTAEWLHNLAPEARAIAMAAIQDGVRMRDRLHMAAVAAGKKRERKAKDPSAPATPRKRKGGLPLNGAITTGIVITPADRPE